MLEVDDDEPQPAIFQTKTQTQGEKMKKLQLKTIRKAVEKTAVEYRLSLEEHQLSSISQTLKDINDILSKEDYPGRRLFAICEKEPRGNLDTGRHYYSVNYIKNNEIHKAWFWDFIKVFGGYDQNRDRCLDKYVFGSGAIGMSRVLDATDGLFSYLKRIGGYYHQIECH